MQYNNYLHGKRYIIIITLDWIVPLSLTWSSPPSCHRCGRLMWPKIFHFVWVYRYGLPKWVWLVTNQQPMWNKMQKRDLHMCLDCDWSPQSQAFDCLVTMIRSESAVYSSSVKFATALMAVWYYTWTHTVLMLTCTHTRRASDVREIWKLCRIG
jgi:hypothetical protein